jgi:antitoxin MazE
MFLRDCRRKNMQINLIQIGNSRGVRLPQNIIKQCGFADTVEAELVDHCLVLKASNKARRNWEKIFMVETDAEDKERDEVLVMQHAWDEEEWQW